MSIERCLSQFSDLSSKQQEKLIKFYKELFKFRKLFLTKKDPEKELLRLIEDGVLSGKLFLEKVSEGKIVDVGSGAGFPGILLAILDQKREIALTEPSLKRSEFLKHCVNLLDIQSQVEIRPQVFSPVKEEIITFKAFAPLKKTLKLVRKYTKKRAKTYHFKSFDYQKDWDNLGSEKDLWNLKEFASYVFENQKRVILEITQKTLKSSKP